MIPDFFEPIVGYRGWNTNLNGWLVSATADVAWEPRKANPARCSVGPESYQHWHPETGQTMPAPMSGCTCGYYAYKQDVPNEYHVTVRGSVKLWGRIIEHETGYRAEFAYPFELRCNNPRLAARLKYLYGVPCAVEAITASSGYTAAMQPMSSASQIQQILQQQNTYLTSGTIGLVGGGASTAASYVRGIWSTASLSSGDDSSETVYLMHGMGVSCGRDSHGPKGYGA